jgi:hypothetical protein
MPAPLVARWRSWSLDPPRAGALTSARAEVENAGSVPWGTDILASYHWLDERGNAIVWDGLRTRLPGTVAPGGSVAVEIAVRSPIPPGRYRLALDLVAEHRAWFSEVTRESQPEAEIDVLARVDGDTLADVAAVHVAEGVEPSADWERRVITLHAEGYAVVAGAIRAPRRLRRALAVWAPGPGRVPGFAHPLLCPSVLRGVELTELPAVEGLAAFSPPEDEPWVYDASLVLELG